MATVLSVYDSHGCVGRCDARCHEAQGDICHCICGGVNYHCLFEYVDGLVGGQRVAQVLPGDDDTPLTLVFANGRAMPLYCADCGSPLQVHADEIEEILSAIAGWHLYALGYAAPTTEEPEYLELVFTPSFEEEEESAPADEQRICVHLESARRIR